MKKPFSLILRFLICGIIYFVLLMAGSASGLIHTAVYAYVGTIMPLFFSFLYLNVTANWKHFGAAAILNAILMIISYIVGEGNLSFLLGIIIFTAVSEIIRKILGYNTIKGLRWSFVPFAFSFYCYVSHWWFYTEQSLQAAREEMRTGYDQLMLPVIQNVPGWIIAIVLVIPVAYFSMMLAEKIMKKSAARLTEEE